MSLTPEQIAANEKSARNLALSKTGLTDIPQQEWTYGQRGAYNKAFADIILAYPDRFSVQAVTTAHDVKQADYSPLANADFSYSDFGKEAASSANDLVGKPLVALGQATGNVFSFIGNFGPYLALAAGLFIAYQFVKAKGKQASKL